MQYFFVQQEGGDDDDNATQKDDGVNPDPGNPDIDDDIAERIGEGHDPIEDPIA